METQLEYARFQKDVWTAATTYAWKGFRDPHIRRQFRVLAVLGRAALPEDQLKEVISYFFGFLLDFLISGFLSN